MCILDPPNPTTLIQRKLPTNPKTILNKIYSSVLSYKKGGIFKQLVNFLKLNDCVRKTMTNSIRNFRAKRRGQRRGCVPARGLTRNFVRGYVINIYLAMTLTADNDNIRKHVYICVVMK